MSDQGPVIVDEPLGDALNFEVLKSKGIAQLKNMVGNTWTNYNESDPGVTILDQLCYALTELGYCADFPIEDVLTCPDGHIDDHDQFFKPVDILTCAPITIDDYRKLVHDQIGQVRAIEIVPERVSDFGTDTEVGKMRSWQKATTGRYHVYLSVQNENSKINEEINNNLNDQVVKRTHDLLNQYRNVGEVFLPPKLLQEKKVQVAGNVYLSQSADAELVNKQILQLLYDYAAPPPIKSGYQELREHGLEADQIFNGPQLTQGWIGAKGALRRKRNQLWVYQLSQLIAKIDGVLYVESLTLKEVYSDKNINNANKPDIVISEVDIAKISSDLILKRNTLEINVSAGLNRSLEILKANHKAVSVAAKVDISPDLPQGKYRNIEQYYSVQHTFPDIYGIGDNSLGSNVSDYRIAQTRQLKGYLMLFDQLLANQFSQLAHIGDLFSFTPRFVPAAQSSAVAASKPFAQTYYSQPLYDVPDVRPLLRGHAAFQYQYDSTQSDKQVAQESWEKFKKFPLNEYIYGLHAIMESETEAVQRRDTMLSHLMARHGDDASQYDDMIKTCQWFGSDAKTRIIVKTIWLQNYQKLSYYRTSAFDFLYANKLLSPSDSSKIAENYLLSRHDKSLNLNQQNKTILQQEWWRYPTYPVIDGELDQARIYAETKLGDTDFENFSTFELKADILLGLSAHLRRLAAILSSLLQDEDFKERLADGSILQAPYHLPDSDVWVVCDHKTNRDLIFEGKPYENKQPLMEIECLGAVPEKDYRAHADQLVWLSMQRKGFLLIEHILLAAFDKKTMLELEETCRYSGAALKAEQYSLSSATLVFPEYVTLIKQPSFQSFIDTLRELHWPAHIAMTSKFVSFNDLSELIPDVIYCHNFQGNINGLAYRLGLTPF